MAKERKTRLQLEGLIAEALGGGVYVPILQHHPTDQDGRTWDVQDPAPNAEVRRAINRLRDQYDLS